MIKSTVGITVEAMGERINLTEICFDLCLYESVEMLNQSVQLMINQNSVMNELLANLQEVQIISNPADADTWEKCNQNVSCIRDSLERHEIWRDLKSAKDLETSRAGRGDNDFTPQSPPVRVESIFHWYSEQRKNDRSGCLAGFVVA